jgi:A/G-specific adenine glycosylase
MTSPSSRLRGRGLVSISLAAARGWACWIDSAFIGRVRVARVFTLWITYPTRMTIDPKTLRLDLLDWYDANARDLPWRVLPSARQHGAILDPYRIWLSEIMLQQTTITTVKPYFEKFLVAFPTIEALAKAPLDDVLSLWAGLGYYARGRNLHKCAIAIVEAGGFPQTPEGLALFPGIGPYTSAAIASIAFDYPSVPVDGNVERVLSRLLRISEPLPASKPIFRDAAQQFEDPHRPGDFAQALMDLGSTICTPRNPKCTACPWTKSCPSSGAFDVEAFPAKTPKKLKPIRYGTAFVHINDDGVLVARRAESGLLGGMLEVPGTDWRDDVWALEAAILSAPLLAQDWQKAEPVRHIFTHFDLRLEVYVAHVSGSDNAKRLALNDLDDAALPSVMMKVIHSALSSAPCSRF